MKKVKSIGRQISLTLLVVAVVFTSTLMPANASSNDQNNEEIAKEASSIISGKAITTMEEFKASGLNCDFSSMLDVSSFYNAVASLDQTGFGKLSYDVPSAVSSTTMLNMEYTALLATMKNAGWGVETTLEIPNLNTGYANNITDKFTATYGDMSDKFELTTTMPEGWTMSEIMAQSSYARNEMSEDIKDSTIYQSVLTNISTGSVFVSANMTLEIPELKSATQLNTSLNESASAMNAEWDQKKQEGIAEIQKESADNKSFAEFSSKQDLQDLFDEACGNTNAWLLIAEQEALSDETSVTKAMLMQQTMSALADTMDAEASKSFEDWKKEEESERKGFDYWQHVADNCRVDRDPSSI